jgi:hypothetical protein
MRGTVWLVLTASVLLAFGCSGGDSAGDLTAFCAQVDGLSTNDPFASFGDTASPEEMKVAFGALVERADELAAPAPADIAGAATRYSRATRQLDRLLARAGYDGRRVEVLAYGNAQADYDEAKAQIERFAIKQCADR